MRNVSQLWKNNQKQNFVSEADIKITLDMTDPEAIADAEATANNSTYYSKTGQVTNDKDKSMKNYATLEQNFWCLDDSTKVLPPYSSGLPLENIGDVGYVSNVLSNDDCTFAPNPIITLEFSKVFTTTVPAITLSWNHLCNEYATDFKITIYNRTDVLHEKLIENNKLLDCIILGDFADYDKITIEIIKWCKPIARARLTNIDLGISKDFLKDEIISLTISESTDTIGASLPTNRLRFELDNSADFFNPYNEEGFDKYLCRRQRIIAKVGYYNAVRDATEWIQMGEYYLSNWDSPQNKISANFEANNLLSFLNNRRYMEGNVTSTGITLYNLAESLLLNSGLRKNSDGSNKWVLSSILQNITTTGILPVCTQLEALQYIAQAACCVLFCDNNGNIHIEPISLEPTDYEVNMFNSYQFPEVEVQKVLGRVLVNCYANKSSETSSELFNGILEINGDETIAIEFSNPTLDTSALQFTVTGATSYSSVLYNNGCVLTLIGCLGLVTVVITGKTIDTSSRVVTIISDNSAEDEQDIDNPLITDYNQAKTVGVWVKNWLVKRNQITTEWRCDPRLNALDKILVENKYETSNAVRLTSLEMSYKGGFKGKITGRII